MDYLQGKFLVKKTPACEQMRNVVDDKNHCHQRCFVIYSRLESGAYLPLGVTQYIALDDDFAGLKDVLLCFELLPYSLVR